jgi:hypothetical protein
VICIEGKLDLAINIVDLLQKIGDKELVSKIVLKDLGGVKLLK